MPYKTISMRVPVALKAEVERMSGIYRQQAQLEDYLKKKGEKLTPETHKKLMDMLEAFRYMLSYPDKSLLPQPEQSIDELNDVNLVALIERLERAEKSR